MADFGGMAKWMEAHPTESIVIGAGGLIAVLWMFGAFSKSAPASSADAGTANMAAAYYAAEAQQAVVGGQIQVANINATATTAQASIAANAATAINASNANAAITVNGQNADATTTLGLYGLNATLSNNATTLGVAQSDNSAALTTDFMNNIFPMEMANTPGSGFNTNIPGVSGTFSYWGATNPNAALAAGFSPSYIDALFPGQQTATP
jgi:hypothetical protein